MMMKRFGWLVLAGMVLAGCNGGAKTTQNIPPTGSADGSTVPPVDNPADPGVPTPGTEPGAARPPVTKDDLKPPGLTGTQPGKDGTGVAVPRGLNPEIKLPDVKINVKDDKWKTPTETTSPTVLAKKMDDAFRNLKNAKVDAQISYDVPSVGKLNGETFAKIEDKDTFIVEYFMPATSGNKNRMVSNDGRSAFMRNGAWVKGKPNFNTSKTATPQGAMAWEERFSEEMYARFLTNQDGWGPIIKAWETGQGGYKLKMEQTMTKDKRTGKDRPIYRLLATREGDSKAMVEVRVDGARYLPVAIRVIRTNKDGSEEKMFWNGAWSFGGTFDKKEFPVPKIKS